jgi:DNA repair exonuclease SbcCD ATPase subunit
MGAKENLQKLFDKKQQEIRELELQLAQAKSYLQAIQDSIKALPRDSAEAEQALRQGSGLAKARQALHAAGKPMHVSEILKAIGKPNDKPNRISLSGSLGNYARKKQIFTKPSPNTFGLISFGNPTKSKEEDDLPESFGTMQ